MSLSIDPVVQDHARRAAAIKRLREIGGRLPTWSELAGPPKGKSNELSDVGPDDADPRNLWRVHWFNGPDPKTAVGGSGHNVLSPEKTRGEKPNVLLLVGAFSLI